MIFLDSLSCTYTFTSSIISKNNKDLRNNPIFAIWFLLRYILRCTLIRTNSVFIQFLNYARDQTSSLTPYREIIERSRIGSAVSVSLPSWSVYIGVYIARRGKCLVTRLRPNWNRLSLMFAGGGRNRMKCRLGLARSSGTESSRRPPRVVNVLRALPLSVPF